MYLKEKVDRFSEYFINNLSKIQHAIDNNNQNYFETIKEEINKMIVDVGFYIGKNNSDDKYQLEFETLFDNEKKILTSYICQNLEGLNLSNWQFLYYKQFYKEDIIFYDKHINFQDISLLPIVEKDGVKIFFENSELFSNLNDEEKFLLTYIILVSAIGELNVENTISKIEILNRFDRIKYHNNKKISASNLFEYLKDRNIVLVNDDFLQISMNEFKNKKGLKGSTYCLELVSDSQNKATDILLSNNLSLTNIKFKDHNNIIKKELFELLKTDAFIVTHSRTKEYEQVEFLIFSENVKSKIEKFRSENKNVIKE